jgi:hypothetical protein
VCVWVFCVFCVNEGVNVYVRCESMCVFFYRSECVHAFVCLTLLLIISVALSLSVCVCVCVCVFSVRSSVGFRVGTRTQ